MSGGFNPFEPPAASRDADVPDAVVRGGRSASLSARFGAATIDVAATFVVAFFISKAFGISFQDPRISELLGRSGALLVSALLLTAMHGYWLARYGQTIGKRMVGIRIVNAVSGERASFSRLVLLRILPLQIAPLLPFATYLFLLDTVLIFRKDRRCLHDLVAGTRVVVAD